MDKKISNSRLDISLQGYIRSENSEIPIAHLVSENVSFENTEYKELITIIRDLLSVHNMSLLLEKSDET